MLTPEKLLRIVETMHPLIDELNQFVTNDMIRRLMARFGRGDRLTLTGTDKWQAEALKMAGGHLEAVKDKLKEYGVKSDDEMRAIFEDAGISSWGADEDFYLRRGFEPMALLEDARMRAILQDSYRRTRGELNNLTRTTATKSQQTFFKALDLAHLKVMTGAQSYTVAVRDAVRQIAESQAQVVYPSGWVDTVEVATLRAVRTGTAQASGNLAIAQMEERGWDLVRVSAHIGARYGDGGQNPGNHFWWQGKLYSLSGASEKYPPFAETTGYGLGEGLCGWNCRHSFGPGDEDFNPWEKIDEEANKKAYDLSQEQRAMERDIRNQKRKVMATKEALDNCQDAELKAGLEEDYGKEALKLEQYNKRYNSFCEGNGLKKLSDRISIAKWDRKQAMSAVRAADRYNRVYDDIYASN